MARNGRRNGECLDCAAPDTHCPRMLDISERRTPVRHELDGVRAREAAQQERARQWEEVDPAAMVASIGTRDSLFAAQDLSEALAYLQRRSETHTAGELEGMLAELDVEQAGLQEGCTRGPGRSLVIVGKSVCRSSFQVGE